MHPLSRFEHTLSSPRPQPLAAPAQQRETRSDRVVDLACAQRDGVATDGVAADRRSDRGTVADWPALGTVLRSTLGARGLAVSRPLGPTRGGTVAMHASGARHASGATTREA